jgi:lysophospholipase L1-like esterase
LPAPPGSACAREPQATNSATTPAPRVSLRNRHEKFVEIARRGNIDILFLGDSITDLWGGEGHLARSQGAKIFQRDWEPQKTANFGIAGDQTQHVLWRIQNGELDGIHPKVVMLMIGTNNMGPNSAREIADGITAIVKEIHKRSPDSKVLLLGIFPRGEKPAAVRDKIKEVNNIISRLDDGGATIKYLDIGGQFVQQDGTISRKIMYDFTHLTEKGYQMWADSIKGPINELMGKK